MLNLTDELFQVTILDDAQVAILDRNLEAAGGEGADKNNLLGILADVDEASGAREAWAELAYIEIPCWSACARPRKAASRPPPS